MWATAQHVGEWKSIPGHWGIDLVVITAYSPLFSWRVVLFQKLGNFTDISFTMTRASCTLGCLVLVGMLVHTREYSLRSGHAEHHTSLLPMCVTNVMGSEKTNRERSATHFRRCKPVILPNERIGEGMLQLPPSSEKKDTYKTEWLSQINVKYR